MKKSTQRKMNLIGMVIVGVNVICAIVVVAVRLTSHQDPLQQGRLTLQTVPAVGTVLSDVRTCVHRNEFVVVGHIESDEDSAHGGQTRVSFTLLSPGGEILERKEASYTLSASHSPARTHLNERLNTVPPVGSVLRIEWSKPTSPKDLPSLATASAPTG